MGFTFLVYPVCAAVIWYVNGNPNSAVFGSHTFCVVVWRNGDGIG